MCTCENQLQPHERMDRVCPPRHEELEAAVLAGQGDGPATDVFDDLWLDLGGES